MQPVTTSATFPKSILAICRPDDPLDDLDIENNCFWLGLLYKGSATFDVGGKTIKAKAPCFICFDETQSPRLVQKKNVRCDSVYFNPTYININMTFENIHSANYREMAACYDLFMCSPFTDREQYVIPFYEESFNSVKRMYAGMVQEFTCQTDWYWSCRSRSYFMQILMLVDRSYGYAFFDAELHGMAPLQNNHLRNAVVFVESHYMEPITLADIVEAAGINHTTLTRVIKAELGVSPMEYVWRQRLRVAQKLLEFTDLAVKDVAERCGFKTINHFCRKFEQCTGMTPTSFRARQLQKRREGFGAGRQNACAMPRKHENNMD